MRNRVTMWVFVRVVRLAIVVERAANAVREVCQGIQAAYNVLWMLGIPTPELHPQRAPLRLVK